MGARHDDEGSKRRQGEDPQPLAVERHGGIVTDQSQPGTLSTGGSGTMEEAGPAAFATLPPPPTSSAAWRRIIRSLSARSKIPAASELHVGNPLPLAGVMNLDGPADLNAALSVQQSLCGRPAITELIGGSPQERPERHRHASPVELLPLGVPQVC